MKYIVWVKENGFWLEQGEGEMTLKQATRIAREIRQSGYPAIFKPVGIDPNIRKKSRNPAGLSPLMIGLAGVGLYLLWRQSKGMGSGEGYASKPATKSQASTAPRSSPVFFRQPAAPSFWTRVKEVAASPFQTAPSVPALSMSTQNQIFEQVNKIAKEIIAGAYPARQPAAAPQYKVMEQVDFSIADDRPKTQMEQLQEYGKRPGVVEKERLAEQSRQERLIEQDRPKSQWERLAERGEEVKHREEKAQKTLNEMTSAMETEVLSVEALAADLRAAQAEAMLESDPDLRASAVKSAMELADLHNLEKKRVADKIGRLADGYLDHLYASIMDVDASKAKIAPVYQRMLVRVQESTPKPIALPRAKPVVLRSPGPAIPETFTPMQRARVNTSIDDDIFGM